MSADEPQEDVSASGGAGGDGSGKPAGSDGKGDEAFEVNGTKYERLADGEYDVIVLGTGLTECVVGGLLATRGMKVLQLDRNGYYGGDSASLNLTHLYRKFVAGSDSKDEEPPKDFFDALGSNRDYNVDLIPKFIMADGLLVKMLTHTGVNRYLDFKQVAGSFVWKKGSGVHKVPATEVEAVATSLMGFFQKRKFKNFLSFVAKYDDTDPKTHEGRDLKAMTMADLYKAYGLDDNTQDFTGHAFALRTDDEYLDKPAIDCVRSIQLYAFSLNRYGESPFIYPLYGLGGLPEGFSRHCAIHGGTFILNKAVDEILFNKDGQAVGVRSGKEAARSPIIIGDPSYFPDAMKEKTGEVIRSVCIMNHPVPEIKDKDSAQIILPQKQVGRHNDIYVSVLSSAHCVTAKGKYVAICSTTVEDKGGKPEEQLAPAIALLGGAGSLTCRFDQHSATYRPKDDGRANKCFISRSYDATSHFESVSNDIMDLYERITGEKLDLDGGAAGGAGGASGGAGGSGK